MSSKGNFDVPFEDESLEEEEDRSDLPAEVRYRCQAYEEGKTKPISLEELLVGLD
jgi:hypothetical protein